MEIKLSIETLNKELKTINHKISIYKIIKVLSYPLHIVIIGHFILKKVKITLDLLINQKKDKTELILKKLKDIKNSFNRAYNEFLEEDTYLIYDQKEDFLSQITLVKNLFNEVLNIIDKKQFNLEILQNNINELNSLKQEINSYNYHFIRNRKNKYISLFKTDYGELDQYQKEAIIIDDKYNLVVAGAGSGKTEVLIRRIAYLIKRTPDNIDKNKILSIAFQNKASKEIKERLSKNFDVNVDVRTFHSLGKKILEDSGKKISLFFNGDNFDKEYNKFINTQYELKLKESNFKKLIFNYIKYFNDNKVKQKEDSFEDKEEYFEYNKNLRYTTLNETKVKSEFEREVMNFFLTHKLNGKKIKIKYEEKAQWMSYVNENEQTIIPSPDFFFPELGIYLECWALDKSNKVPDWFEGDDPTNKYINDMNLKRNKFNENKEKYQLIEISYGDYQRSNNFTSLIKEKFIASLNKKNPNEIYSIEEVPYEELVENLWEECKASIKVMPMNIARFITIAKTYGFNTKNISQRLNEHSWTKKQIAFTNIALEIFLNYESNLEKEKKIDFSDMINLAVKELNTNTELYRNKFEHILIDEYQDISYQRYLLVNELLKKNSKCKLFVVGDDWQSIMSFTGSNLDYFVNFSKYFPNPQRTDLINNYRSIKSIVDCGSDLIKLNGNSQISKKTIAYNPLKNKINVILSLHKKGYETNYIREMTKHCIDVIKQKIDSGIKPNDILILSRIMSNKVLLNHLFQAAKSKGIQISEFGNTGNNKVNLMSVHKSKGLQAKVVLILDVTKGMYGFPCELENLSIFDVATLNKFENEKEERRLFYVALTRAKEELYIYTMKDKKSKFLDEIKEYSNFEELRY
jgi:DNA helicase-4